MTKKEFTQLATNIIGVIALVLVAFGVLQPDTANQPTARGVSNFDDITLSGDLAVGDDATVTGDLAVTGQTSFTDDLGNTVNLCDATAADCKIQYDGIAQDYYLALDDSADDFLLGLGSAVGTTGIIYLDENQDVGLGGASAGAKLDITGNQLIDGAADEIQLQVQGYTTQTTSLQVWEQSDGTDVATMSNAGLLDLSGELNYGSNDLSVLGYASAGEQLVVGTSLVTGTATAAHGLTTVTFALCTLGEDPTAGAGDGAMCTVTVSGNTVTLKVWQDDFVTAATETDVDVHWLVVGTP